MNNIQIILNKRADRNLLKTGSFLVDVISNYSGVRTLEFNLNSMDATYREAFQKTIDYASIALEANAFIFIINRTGKTFNLGGSYVRDAISTTTPLTSLPAGTPLKVRFEVPGFSTNNFREIDLWIGNSFDPADVALVAEIGISLSGNGGSFTIDNITDCKVSFSKPDTALEEYIIQDEKSNDIITP